MKKIIITVIFCILMLATTMAFTGCGGSGGSGSSISGSGE